MGCGKLSVMEIITRQVSALEPAVREAIEVVVGHSLQANQRIVVQVLDAEPFAKKAESEEPHSVGVHGPGHDAESRSRAEIIAKLPTAEELDEFAMEPPREWLQDKTWADGTI